MINYNILLSSEFYLSMVNYNKNKDDQSFYLDSNVFSIDFIWDVADLSPSVLSLERELFPERKLSLLSVNRLELSCLLKSS